MNLSCEDSKEIFRKKIEGLWAIDSIYYNGENFKDSLYLNTLSFEKELVRIPKIEGYDYLNSAAFYLETTNNTKKLIIRSKNHFFNGVYEVSFIKNEERKLLGMKLKSSKMTIIAYKFHQDYIYDEINW